MRHYLRTVLVGCALLVPFATHTVVFADNRVSAASEADLTSLVSPYALYPDDVLIHVFDASTNSSQVANAYKVYNSGLEPSAHWDESVIALYSDHGPILKLLAENLAMTERLGTTYERAPDQVWHAVIKLRVKAKNAGTYIEPSQIEPEIIVNTSTAAQPSTSDAPSTLANADAAMAGLAGFGAGAAAVDAVEEEDVEGQYYPYPPPGYYNGYYGGVYYGDDYERDYNTRRGDGAISVDRDPGSVTVHRERSYDTARGSGSVERSRSVGDGYESTTDISREGANYELDRSRSVEFHDGQAYVEHNVDIYNKNTGESKSWDYERPRDPGSWGDVNYPSNGRGDSWGPFGDSKHNRPTHKAQNFQKPSRPSNNGNPRGASRAPRVTPGAGSVGSIGGGVRSGGASRGGGGGGR